jgi:hypothetical protein
VTKKKSKNEVEKMNNREVQLYTLDGKKERKKRTDYLTDIKVPLSPQLKNVIATRAVMQQTTISKLTISLIYSIIEHNISSVHTLKMPHLTQDHQYENRNPHIHIRIPHQMVSKIADVRIAEKCSLRKACFILLVHELIRLRWIE